MRYLLLAIGAALLAYGRTPLVRRVAKRIGDFQARMRRKCWEARRLGARLLFREFERVSVQTVVTVFDMRLGRRLFLPLWTHRLVPGRWGGVKWGG